MNGELARGVMMMMMIIIRKSIVYNTHFSLQHKSGSLSYIMFLHSGNVVRRSAKNFHESKLSFFRNSYIGEDSAINMVMEFMNVTPLVTGTFLLETKICQEGIYISSSARICR